MNRLSKLTVAIGAASVLASGTASAQSLTLAQAHALLDPFYSALNQPSTKDTRALLEKTLAPEWKSYSSETEFKGRDAFMGQVAGFGKVIPDLKWDVKEMLVSGNRVIVRSMASGTPQGQFMGMPVAGNKSFSIMAIDIHTIVDGKAVVAHHVEDWAAAMRQLKP